MAASPSPRKSEQTSLTLLHAAGLRLGSPFLSRPDLSTAAKEWTDAATYHTWTALQRHAIGSGVDVVLLTGNTFIEAEQSLSARLALLEGLEHLMAEAIPIVIVPGPLDPPSAWSSAKLWPSNVHFVTTTQPERSVIELPSGVQLAIGPVGGSVSSPTADVQIGLLDRTQTVPENDPAAYFAVVCSDVTTIPDRSTEHSGKHLIHAPGSPQPLGIAERSAGYASLVHLPVPRNNGSEDVAEPERLPTGCCRRLTFDISAEDDPKPEVLVDRMWEAFASCDPLPTERYFEIDWLVDGVRRYDENTQVRMWKLLDEAIGDSNLLLNNALTRRTPRTAGSGSNDPSILSRLQNEIDRLSGEQNGSPSAARSVRRANELGRRLLEQL